MKKKSLLKTILIRVGLAVLALLVSIIGLGIWISPEKMDFDSPYHPFKSEQAKEQYLKLYDERAEKWPVPSTTQIIQTSYGKTFVRISGQKNAPPLILMHGAGGNSLQWISSVGIFAKDYRVYAIDNIYDNGRSIPEKIMTDANDYADWLDELFDKLSLKQGINIVGLSYGGWITTQYALKHPKRLRKVVLLAPVGTVAPLSPEWIARAVSVMIPSKYFARNFVYWLAEDTVNSGSEGRAIIDEHVDEAYMAIRSFRGKDMVNPTVLSNDELQSIHVPVLFIVGENEKIYSPSTVLTRLHEVAPQIKTELVKGAGHDLTTAQSQKVNRLILEFLK